MEAELADRGALAGQWVLPSPYGLASAFSEPQHMFSREVTAHVESQGQASAQGP